MEQQSLSGLLTTKETGALTKLSRTSLWRMTREGRFPAPRELGQGQIRWSAEDVRDWLSNLPSRQYPGQQALGKRGKVPTHHGAGHV